MLETALVPDLGGVEHVKVIEFCCQPGQELDNESAILVLESDKATMDVPSPVSGVFKRYLVSEGDDVCTGDPIAEIEIQENEITAPILSQTDEANIKVDKGSASKRSKIGVEDVIEIVVPDTGSSDLLEVTEVLVSPDDVINEGDALIVLESDKSTVEVPSSHAGTIVEVLISVSDQIKSGDAIVILRFTDTPPKDDQSLNRIETLSDIPSILASGTQKTISEQESVNGIDSDQPDRNDNRASEVYAGPSVRMLARELGVDLKHIKGTGMRGRITREDLNNFVHSRLSDSSASGKPVEFPGSVADEDFSSYGRVETHEVSRIQAITSERMVMSWSSVPHVTQHDEADITELEAFRQSLRSSQVDTNNKVTLVAFLLKAVTWTLKKNPAFNRSLINNGRDYIQKHYFHIGVAVDTPRGLLVPVIKDTDQKGILELAEDVKMAAERARNGKLPANEMKGGCFTISSLGAIGGTGFTPIINSPEVGILGVARAANKPYWDGTEFVPRLYLPLSLSYDHRIINGVQSGNFMGDLVQILGDIRFLVL